MSTYEQGGSEIGAEVLLRLSHISRKSIEWILTGKAVTSPGVLDDGALSRQTASALSRVFRWEELNAATLERNRAGEERDPEKLAQWREQILTNIRKMIEELKQFLNERQASEESAIVERYSIPGKDALNRILKYQTLNDRRLERALTRLERLQRQRRGD